MTLQKLTTTVLCLGLLLLISCKKDPESGQQLPPSLSAGDLTERENALFISFVVKLSEAATTPVSIDYATSDGTAQGGVDYVAMTGTLVFNPGEILKTIILPLVDDELQEPTETFRVKLSNPVGATLERAEATMTILDDFEDNPFVIPATGYSTPENYAGKIRIWDEEFDGPYVANPWAGFGGFGGWGNNELQNYQSQNARISFGKLIMEARNDGPVTRPYTSARFTTQDLKEFKFGRIDIRAVVPEGQGILPVLWLTGTNIPSVGDTAAGQIDIMQLFGNQPNRVHGTAHYGTDQPLQDGGTFDLPGNAKFSEEFHVFSVIWEENHIRWLVDDVLYHEITAGSIAPANYPFNQACFLNFKIAVGGDVAGSPDATTVFPQRMMIDYVRVFQ